MKLLLTIYDSEVSTPGQTNCYKKVLKVCSLVPMESAACNEAEGCIEWRVRNTHEGPERMIGPGEQVTEDNHMKNRKDRGG